MRGLNSRISGNHGSSWRKPILLFSLLCFLVAFNLSFANGPTNPSTPNLEHPWDDLYHSEREQVPVDPPGPNNFLILPLGVGSKIIIHVQPAAQKGNLGRDKVYGPSEKAVSF